MVRPRATALILILLIGLMNPGHAPTLVAMPQSPSVTAPPVLAGCPMFPANNVWNTPIDHLPVDARSNDYINTIGPSTGLHPDFGTVWNGAPNGIPYTTVLGTQPPVTVTFGYWEESDPGPYPIPPNAPIEGGPNSNGDRHVLVVDRDNCKLYEMWSSYPQPDGSWQAGSGAVFNLRSNALRPATWTSADAAGLPILPGLVRYDEVATGSINHAIRFTVNLTQKKYVWPARHYASSSTDPARPPMGQRFRLKKSFNVSTFSPQIQVILRAFQTYGLILADNGGNWFISGVPDPRWNDDMLVNELRNVRGSDFEAVDVSSLMLDPNSGKVAPWPVTDLRVSQAITSPNTLTVTLRWTPPAYAITTTLRYSNTAFAEANWPSTLLLTNTLPGQTNIFTAAIPYQTGVLYLGLKAQEIEGLYSPLSNLAFWPHQDVFLPIVLRQ